MLQKIIEAPNFRQTTDHPSRRHGTDHSHHKLKTIGPYDAAQSAHQRVDHRHRTSNRHHHPWLQAEQDPTEFAAGEHHVGHAQAVKDDTKIKGAKRSQPLGRTATVTDLVKLEVRENLTPLPEACVDKSRKRSRQ